MTATDPTHARTTRATLEWPTLAVLVATYGLFALGTTLAYGLHPALGIVLTGLAIAQFSSLQHEVLHGHPFADPRINHALVFPALTLTVPFGRFRDTHLAHHHDPNLTDPYDDPESNFHDPAVWARLPAWRKALHQANNTLLGRMVLGPILGNAEWLAGEVRALRAGQPGVRRDWLLHLGGLVLLVAWVWPAEIGLWGYLGATWIGHGLLKIRTYLEHRAHVAARARTVVVERGGLLALLFLNNNLHVVHHMHPAVAWYRLPALYAQNRAHYLRRNEGYRYASYAEVFARYLWRAKDPVPHPIWPVDKGDGWRG
jgi:fatty acid desaturase